MTGGQPTSISIGWTKRVRPALLYANSLAATALAVARGRVATGRRKCRRLQAELDQAHTEIALLKEEVDIKDARWSRLCSRRRPHYTPFERMRILQLKAARGWSREQAAQAFLVDEQTTRSWLRRVDEEGERALVRISEPVNKFPDFVRYLVKQLKALLPTMGRVRIAQIVARAGLHLGATTVERMLKESGPVPEEAVADIVERPLRPWVGGRHGKCTRRSLPRMKGVGSNHEPTGRGEVHAHRRRRRSEVNAERSSLWSSTTWKAGGACRSSSFGELLDPWDLCSVEASSPNSVAVENLACRTDSAHSSGIHSARWRRR